MSDLERIDDNEVKEAIEDLESALEENADSTEDLYRNLEELVSDINNIDDLEEQRDEYRENLLDLTDSMERYLEENEEVDEELREEIESVYPMLTQINTGSEYGRGPLSHPKGQRDSKGRRRDFLLVLGGLGGLITTGYLANDIWGSLTEDDKSDKNNGGKDPKGTPVNGNGSSNEDLICEYEGEKIELTDEDLDELANSLGEEYPDLGEEIRNHANHGGFDPDEENQIVYDDGALFVIYNDGTPAYEQDIGEEDFIKILNELGYNEDTECIDEY